MHDVRLEDHLRRSLRAEADSLPFTLTPDELYVRLATRRRAAFGHRLAILAAAGLAIVAVGVGAFLASRPPEEPVVVPPSQSAIPSGSPRASDSPEPSAQPVPQPSIRATGPVGGANDAVVVSVVGSATRPSRIDVSLVTIDAAALETNPQPRPLASFPGSTIAADYGLDPDPPRYGPDGWLAIGVISSSTSVRSMLIYDLRGPEREPWLVVGDVAGAAWNGGSVIASADGGIVRLYDASTRTTSTLSVPPDAAVGDTISDPSTDTPHWTADGTGFLAWHRTDSPRTYGVLRLDGTFATTPSALPARQSTGIERRWSVDWAETSEGCPTEGGPPGCSVSTDIGGGESTMWYAEDAGLGSIVDTRWDAAGTGLWLLVHRTSESPTTYVVMHADAPDQWQDVTSFLAAEGVGPAFAGLRDAEPTADGKLFLFADAGGRLAITSGDGSTGSLSGTFAGWAGAQPPYPGP